MNGDRRRVRSVLASSSDSRGTAHGTSRSACDRPGWAPRSGPPGGVAHVVPGVGTGDVELVVRARSRTRSAVHCRTFLRLAFVSGDRASGGDAGDRVGVVDCPRNDGAAVEPVESYQLPRRVGAIAQRAARLCEELEVWPEGAAWLFPGIQQKPDGTMASAHG